MRLILGLVSASLAWSQTLSVPQQASGTWAKAGTLLSAADQAYVMNDGLVFVPASDLVGTVGPQIGDPVTNAWTMAPPNIYSRIAAAAVVLNDGRVLVTGGQTSLNTAELYDPVAKAWRLANTTMSAGRYFHRMTKLNDGTVLLTGGCSAYACGTAAAASEIFDPSTDTFTQAGVMSTGRTFHTANLLNSGKVLIAGGYTAAGASNISEVYALEQRQRQKQRHHSGLAKLQSRSVFAVSGHGRLRQPLDAGATQAAVVADTFDLQQAPVVCRPIICKYGRLVNPLFTPKSFGCRLG